jgi:hypothetical protein
MFGGARSNIGATGSGPVGSRCDALLHSGVIDCDLGGRHPVDLALVVEVAVLEVHLVVLAVSALHHVVVVHRRHVLGTTAEALGREDFLLGTDYVDALLRLVDLVLEQSQETATGCIAKDIPSTSMRSLFRMISKFSSFMLTPLNCASA